MIFLYLCPSFKNNQFFVVMKNLTLTETEVNELLDLYESEVARAQRRINNLQSLIKRMRNEADEAPKSTKRGRPTKKAAPVAAVAPVAAETAAAPQKRGRKPKAAAAVKAETAAKTPSKATAKPAKASKTAAAKAEKTTKAAKATKTTKTTKASKAAKPAKAAKTTKAAVAAEAGVAKKATAPKKTAKAKRKTTRKAKTRPTHYRSIKGHGGPKMKWTDTIVEVIRSKGFEPMSSNDIASLTIAKLGIDKEDVGRAKSAVATNLTKLVKEGVVNKIPAPGKRGSVYRMAQVVAPSFFKE